ncbi:MAG: methenyltetrahydrofolate cyclohydrolase [Acidithiobacillales bacterium SM23_46]|jgi:methylenetetrahydrofolate dehydrogenase (NADP+)/methenyltetrahydrofolate cyclohydrolase|nr:MAG: methenyltetrahydrofolate cyclohydrolase [Acidithiobacillales bacterium SM23_46]
MTAHIIDGNAIARALRGEIARKVRVRLSGGRAAPGLAVIMVGNNPASEVYVRSKRRDCAEVGIRDIGLNLPANIGASQLLAEIDRFNADPSVDGILVQLPLPTAIDPNTIIERIRPDKDVDGFHPYNIGRLVVRMPLLRPCTPYGAMRLLESTGVSLRGQHAVVVGASNIVGRPMALELLLVGCTVTICHSATRNLAAEVARADILVVAIGKPQMIPGDWIKPGALVVDVGINRLADNRIVGDVHFESACERAGWITPVPGGVGPMTRAILLHNTLLAADRDRP